MASPVTSPDAAKLPRCAPPNTDGAGEEPWPGGAGSSFNHICVQVAVAVRNWQRTSFRAYRGFGLPPERLRDRGRKQSISLSENVMSSIFCRRFCASL